MGGVPPAGGMLLAALLVTAGLCALPHSGETGRVLQGLWCFLGLFQLPLLFLLLGNWSRSRAETLPQTGRLAAGFLVLWTVGEALIFWAGAPGGTPRYVLAGDGGGAWLFLAVAACLMAGALLDRLIPGRYALPGRLAALLLAGALGCLAGGWGVLGRFWCLDRVLAFLPFFLAGRWFRLEQLMALLDRRPFHIAGGAALLAALAVCLILPGRVYACASLLRGDAGKIRFWDLFLRLGQYAAGALLVCALLSLTALLLRQRGPRGRKDRWFLRLEERWMAVWFWMCPALTLARTALPGGQGLEGLVLLPACALLGVFVGGRGLPAQPVERLLAIPGALVDGPEGRPNQSLSRRAQDRVFWPAFWAVFFVVVTAFASYFQEHELSMVWSPDGQNLYLTIMYYSRDYAVEAVKTLLHSGKLVLPQWDFSIGQGSSVLSVFHFNPLFLLTLLAPYRWMEGMYGLITLLQIPLAGLAFVAWCRAAERREPLPVLTGALVYACSGFVIFTAAKHIYFITFMVIYLPLILAGCERWLRRRKWGLFVGMIFLSVAGGYYYAFINTVLMAAYLLIRELCLYWGRWKQILFDLLQLVGLYLWGFLLAMPAFLPVVGDFLSSSRSDVAGTRFTLFYTAQHYLWLLLRLVGSDPVGANWARLGFAGIAFTAGVVLFLRWREKALRPLQAGVLVGLFCLCVPLMGKILNGFGYVTNRWSYGFAFCLAVVTVWMLPRLVELSALERVLLTLLTGGYIALVLLLELTVPYVHRVDWTAMLLLALVTLLVLVCCHWRNKAGGQAALAGMTAAAVLFNIAVFYRPENASELGDYVPQGQVMAQLYESPEYVAKQEKLCQDTFCRVETEANRNNRFCLTGGYGTTSYWSVLDAGLVNYCLDFDLNTVRQSYAVWGLDERMSLCALAGVRYFVGYSSRENGNPSDYQPYGFEKRSQRGRCTVYENRYALPLGYAYRGWMTRSVYEGLTPLQRQQAILQGAVVEDAEAAALGDLVPVTPRLTDTDIPFTICEVKDAAVSEDGTAIEAEKGGFIRLEFDAPPEAEVYVAMDGLKMKKGRKRGVTLRVSGNNVTKKGAVYVKKSLYHFAREGMTFNLGASEGGFHHCKITFEDAGIFTMDSLRLTALPVADYEEDVTALRECVLTDVEERGDRVSGSIHLDEPRLLTLSIPCRKGWSLTVDGKPARALRVNGMYLGVLLPAGDHTVAARYRIPGLAPGLVCSAAALVFTLCAAVWGGLRRGRRRADRRGPRHGGRREQGRPEGRRQRRAPPARSHAPAREDPEALEAYLTEVDENPFVEDAFDPRAERLRQNYAAGRQSRSGRGKKGGARLKK